MMLLEILAQSQTLLAMKYYIALEDFILIQILNVYNRLTDLHYMVDFYSGIGFESTPDLYNGMIGSISLYILF